jgi:hypothetical protein
MSNNLTVIGKKESSTHKMIAYDVSEDKSYDCDFMIVVSKKGTAEKMYSYYYDRECVDFYMGIVEDSFMLQELHETDSIR